MLTLIFAFAGVYKITSGGWLHSVRLCCYDNAGRVAGTGVESSKIPSECEPLLK